MKHVKKKPWKLAPLETEILENIFRYYKVDPEAAKLILDEFYSISEDRDSESRWAYYYHNELERLLHLPPPTTT